MELVSPGHGGMQVLVCPHEDAQQHFGLERLGSKPGFCTAKKISLARGCRHLAREEVKPWFG